MQTQSQWMELYKNVLNLTSDGQLARHWNMKSCEISLIHSNRRRLTTAQKLMIANALEIDPVQVFVSCDWDKVKDHDREFAKSEYFKSAMKTYRGDPPRSFYKKRRY